MSSNGTKVESSIPNWVVYALLGTVTFLIVNSIHAALLTLLVSGAVMLFIWSYMSKPIAEIQPPKEETIFTRTRSTGIILTKLKRQILNTKDT